MPQPNITLRQIQTFLTVAELRSFSGAAERLRVSNPWVSETIRELETQLGAKLLSRTTRSVDVTDAGRLFAHLAGQAVADLDAAVKAVRRASDPTRGALQLGYTIGAGLEVVPWLLRSFAQRHPHRHLTTLEFDFTDPSAGLRDSKVHAAIVRPPIGLTGLTTLDLWSEQRIACLPEGHPLAARAELHVRDLLDEPIIAAPEAPGPWRDYWLLSEYRSKPATVVGEASTRDGELHLVGRGVGISVSSESTARWYSRPGVVFRPIVDVSPCRVVLAWWPEHTALVADLVDVANDFAAKSVKESDPQQNFFIGGE
ncbi:DNA-binding transcriptional LysR family regulator [Leifsonia sp. EB41]